MSQRPERRRRILQQEERYTPYRLVNVNKRLEENVKQMEEKEEKEMKKEKYQISKCSNLEEDGNIYDLYGQPVEENDQIQIYLENTEKPYCYSRRELEIYFLKQHIDDEDPTAVAITSWENEETKKRDVVFRLMPYNIWITAKSASLLVYSDYKVFKTYKKKNIPIGSQFGVSRIHGEMHDVWEIKPIVRDKNWENWKNWNKLGYVPNINRMYNANRQIYYRGLEFPVEEVASNYGLSEEEIIRKRKDRLEDLYINHNDKAEDSTLPQRSLCPVCLKYNASTLPRCSWCNNIIENQRNCDNDRGCVISFTKIKKSRAVRKSVRKSRAVRKPVRKSRAVRK